MTNRRVGFLFIVLNLFLVGCSGTFTPTSIVPTETEGTIPATATSMPIVTSTSVLPTVLPTLASPTSTPNSKVKVRCLEIAQEHSLDIEGRLVLAAEGDASRSSYLLDMKTGDQILLPQSANESLLSLVVSPDKKWLAYRKYDALTNTSQIVISTSEGKPQRIIPWGDSWREIAGWLDSEHLLISKESDRLDSLLVFNPFTEQQQELLHKYDNIYNDQPSPDWERFAFSRTIYDSTLSRVIYPSTIGENGAFVLWNIKDNEEIVNFSGAGLITYGGTPKWSPDGQRFAINNAITTTLLEGEVPEELFSVSKDGEVIRLTYLTEYYSETSIGQFNWSPNGQYIAFWLRAKPSSYPNPYSDPGPNPTQRLAILDIAKHEVTNLCIPGGDVDTSLVWSPDSQQIVVENYYDPHFPGRSHVYLVDLTQGFAVTIAEDALPTGWMEAAP